MSQERKLRLLARRAPVVFEPQRTYTIDAFVARERRSGYAGDGGHALDARCYHPSGLAFDAAGDLYIADSNNHAIRRVDPHGTITTIAGGKGPGYSGDGGPAVDAQLFLPTDLAVDVHGDLFVADRDNHAIRRIDRDGVITTFAGGNGRGYTGDGGAARHAQLDLPRALAFDTDGFLYFTDRHNSALRRIDPRGVIVSIVRGDRTPDDKSRPARYAGLHHPRGMTVGLDGTAYVADYRNHRILRVDRRGRATVVAGGNGPGHSGDGGPATRAQLNRPSNVAFGNGGMYITEHANQAVRFVDRHGTISTIAGGRGAGFSGNGGPAHEAALHWPSCVVVAADGSVLVADRNNNSVRRLE